MFQTGVCVGVAGEEGQWEWPRGVMDKEEDQFKHKSNPEKNIKNAFTQLL